jgi:hypothetical protein
MVYPSLISKSKEFSQSISRVAAGGDTIEGTHISGNGDISKKCAKMGLCCVRICVRKTFQNVLKSEKIRKHMENYIKQIQPLVIN